MAKVWLRRSARRVFQRRLRGSRYEGQPPSHDRVRTIMTGSALFSFEGTTRKSHVLLNLENCIEKNFHVSNMKSGLTRSVRVRCKFERRQYVEFKSEKRAHGGYLGITGDEGRSKLR
jgi:hypothetical protein